MSVQEEPMELNQHKDGRWGSLLRIYFAQMMQHVQMNTLEVASTCHTMSEKQDGPGCKACTAVIDFLI